MSEIPGLVLPFFAVIGLGYGAAWFRLIAPEGAGGLHFLVLYVALPALFFQSIRSGPGLDAEALSFVLTTTFATYCAFAIAFSIGALINGGNVPEATVQGLAGSYSNIGYLAPALTIAAFGSAAAAPTAIILTFDHALLFVVTPLMMALGGSTRANPAKLAERIGRDIFLHPIVIATILALVAMAVGLQLPEPVDAGLDLIAAAAPAAALFAFGLALAMKPVVKVSLEMPAAVLVKLIVHPTIVYLLLSWIGGFDRVWVGTAVLLAALPPAMNVLALARAYRVYEARAFDTVFIATAASVATLTIAIVLVLNGMLPADPFR